MCVCGGHSSTHNKDFYIRKVFPDGEVCFECGENFLSLHWSVLPKAVSVLLSFCVSPTSTNVNTLIVPNILLPYFYHTLLSLIQMASTLIPLFSWSITSYLVSLPCPIKSCGTSRLLPDYWRGSTC